MAVQNDNTILKKEDLKKYHQRILPYLGGNVMMRTNSDSVYSDSEQMVGSYLGKPLYKKTITKTFTSNVTTLIIPFSDLDGTLTHDSVVFYKGRLVNGDSGNVTTGIPCYYTTVAFVDLYTYTDGIHLVTGTQYGKSGNKFEITFWYTKPGDAAGSAVTTPGAYDINFPNTWPVNTEIYFGNGVYGKRYTGDFSIAANTRTNTLIDSSLTQSNWFVMSVGGYFDSGSGIIAPIGPAYGSASAPTTLGVYSYLYANASGVRLIHYSENARSNAPYDIWVTYTK